jgi:hypothetical protein
MTRLEALKELKSKVEAGKRVTYDDTDPLVPYLYGERRATFGDAGDFHLACQGQSLDAAKALHEAVLPEWAWSVDRMGQATLWFPWVEGDAPHIYGKADTPARAWLLAILSALIAQEEGQ